MSKCKGLVAKFTGPDHTLPRSPKCCHSHVLDKAVGKPIALVVCTACKTAQAKSNSICVHCGCGLGQP